MTATTRARFARWGLGLVFTLQTLIGLFGINAPVQWGHQGYHVAEHSLGARNLLRHGTWQHSTHYLPDAPPPSALNFHHVTMAHPYVAAIQAVFGEAPWTARAPSLFFALVALGLLWTFVRQTRGPATAGFAALAFVLCPVHIAFCNLPDIQIMSIAAIVGVCVMSWNLCETGPTWGRVLALWGFVLLGSAHDWPFYPAAGLVLLVALWEIVRRPPSWSKSVLDRRRALLALLVALVIPFVIAGQHFGRAVHLGLLDELVGSARGRTTPSEQVEFSNVLFRRLQFSFTLPVLFIAALWLGYCAVNRRHDRALRFVSAVLMGQILWLAFFRAEFVIHDYRTYWFVFPIVFILADAAQFVTGALGQSDRFRSVRWVPAALLLVNVLGLTAVEVLPLSRARAGSIDLWREYRPRHSAMMAARVAKTLAGDEGVVWVHRSLEPRLEMFWLIDSRSRIIDSAIPVKDALARARPVVVIHAVDALCSHPAWHSTVERGRMLVIDGETVVIDFRREGEGSIEVARTSWQPLWGAVGRWLHAPVPGRPRLVAAAPENANRLLQCLARPETEPAREARGADALLAELPNSWIH